jgi:hypothetical protein
VCVACGVTGWVVFARWAPAASRSEMLQQGLIVAPFFAAGVLFLGVPLVRRFPAADDSGQGGLGRELAGCLLLALAGLTGLVVVVAAMGP